MHDFLEQLGREVSLEKKRYAKEKEPTALKTAAEAAEKAAKASKAAEADKAKKQRGGQQQRQQKGQQGASALRAVAAGAGAAGAVATGAAPGTTDQECWDFQNGRCTRLNCKFLHVPKGAHSVNMAMVQTQEMDRMVQQRVAEGIGAAMEQMQAPPFAGRGWHPIYSWG